MGRIYTRNRYNYSSGFNINAGQPIDSRTVVWEKKDLVDLGPLVHPGLIVFVESEDKHYKLVGHDPDYPDIAVNIEENWVPLCDPAEGVVLFGDDIEDPKEEEVL